jgi:hypothetical protein
MRNESKRRQVSAKANPKSFLVIVRWTVNHHAADGYAIIWMLRQSAC